MYLIFDLGLQIQLFQQARDLVLNIRRFTSTLNYFILDGFFDRPESIAILHIFKDELTFFGVSEIHIGGTARQWLAGLSLSVHFLFRKILRVCFSSEI